MSLQKYQRKRDFSKTSEPETSQSQDSNAFVIHKHAASHLHFDLRLSDGFVLKSWAMPHGLPYSKSKKNFAKQVEDHPLDYRLFEGNIPEGEYGGGSVMIYDQGKFETTDLAAGIKKGHLQFALKGKKFNGTFNLIKLKTPDDWIITSDQTNPKIADPLKDRSVSSGKLMAEIFLGNKLAIEKARTTPINEIDNLAPMLCHNTKEPFNNEAWLFEAKLDGYRTLAKINLGSVDLFSRNNQSFNKKFASIHKELKKFKYDAIFDGEIVALDQNGVPNFSSLQNISPEDEKLYYYVFDLIYFEGHDLRNLPLAHRKELLRQLIPDKSKVRYVPHVKKAGKSYFKKLNSGGFEGLIAKKASSRYQSNTRSHDCLKIKQIPETDAIIVGYSNPHKSREYFGSLTLADESMKYIGSVGTGFDTKTLKGIFEKIKGLPEGPPLTDGKNINWVEPRYYARIKYLEKTPTGQLRHPVFLGLLEDRAYQANFLSKAKEKTLNINGYKIKVSNPDKIFFPELKITKMNLIDYYIKNSDRILPFLIDRPENLHRYPDGIHGEHFYHKDTDFRNSPLEFVKVFSQSDHKTINYSVIKNTAGLVYLVNLGCIELNPWLSTTKNINNPDAMVFDLDPGDKVDFIKVIESALLIKNFFDKIKVKTFVKTSGATGLHIFIPLEPISSYESVRLFAEICANLISSESHDLSIERNPENRQDKVYLDYLQNRFGQTIASAYSVRPNEKAGISLPLDWKSLERNDIPASSIFDELPTSKDWQDFFDKSYSIKDLLGRLEKLN